MFDVSFTELLVIGVVALVVIGPERLPKVARTIGHLVGRAQRYVNDVKSDINREMELDELRNLRTEMEQAARSLETTVKANVDDVKQSFDEAHKGLGKVAQDAKAAADDAVQSVNAALGGSPAGGDIPVDPVAPPQIAGAAEAAEPVDAAQPSLFPADALPRAADTPEEDPAARPARVPEKS